jgi:hypothetical protein
LDAVKRQLGSGRGAVINNTGHGEPDEVKVILIDDQGRVKLSRKAVLREESGNGKE